MDTGTTPLGFLFFTQEVHRYDQEVHRYDPFRISLLHTRSTQVRPLLRLSLHVGFIRVNDVDDEEGKNVKVLMIMMMLMMMMVMMLMM